MWYDDLLLLLDSVDYCRLNKKDGLFYLSFSYCAGLEYYTYSGDSIPGIIEEIKTNHSELF